MSNTSQVIILYICLCSCMSPQKFEERAELQKRNFLESVADKWTIKEVLNIKGAKFTLVHIQQQHYSDILTKRLYAELKKEGDLEKLREVKATYFKQLQDINAVQKEIYDFLLSVTNKKDFLYVEGRSFPHHYRDKFLKEYIPSTIEDINKVLNYKELFVHEVPREYYFIGASIPIHQEKRMTVLGVENLSLLNLTLSLYENKKLPKSDLRSFLLECHEAREDQMLKNMSENFEDLPYLMNSIRFLICGSKHSFKKNVEDWNLKNPEKKFNLLTFKPSLLR